MDQPDEVINLARSQLNRENEYFPVCFRSCLIIWFRETRSAVPSCVSQLILQTQAESGSYSRDPSQFTWRRSIYTVYIYIYIYISMGPNVVILPVVTKDLPISPRFTPYEFLSRCKFSTLTSRQPMVEFWLITLFSRFPLRLPTRSLTTSARLPTRSLGRLCLPLWID